MKKDTNYLFKYRIMKTLSLIFILLSSSLIFAQHKFKPLPYSYNALEPYIDAKTVEIHYDRHHRSYFNIFVTAAKGTSLENMDLYEIFENVSKHGSIVRNNAGGWYNHDLYWEIMIPGGSKTPKGNFLNEINKTFGSTEEMIKLINDAAMKRFGSGWAWLIVNDDGKLQITSTPNQDNPLMDVAEIRGIPILGIDVWEHAYYLKYQNFRKTYIDAFWKLVNWDVVGEKFHTAIKK